MPTCEFCELDDPDKLFPVWSSIGEMVDPDAEPAYIGCPVCPGQGNIDKPKT